MSECKLVCDFHKGFDEEFEPLEVRSDVTYRFGKHEATGLGTLFYETCGVQVPLGACESLQCGECMTDANEQFPNVIERAVAAGWTDICWWDGSTYFLGTCPLCVNAAAELAMAAAAN